MTTEELLKITDDLVFGKTGHHLNELQETILRGTIEGKAYKEVVKELKEKNQDKNETYIRKIGSELWEIISDVLDEDVNKLNCRKAIERYVSVVSSPFSQVVTKDSVQINHVNVCHPSDSSSSNTQNNESSSLQLITTSKYDLSEMPELGTFYNRTIELSDLKTWILQKNFRLIALTGITGIGKTVLAVQLVQQIKDKFQYVFWHTLEIYPDFSNFKTNLITLFSQSNPDTEKPLSLIKYFQKYRCLIILDDIHNLFISGELAGKYKSECQDWRSLFKQLASLYHQSCFLLVGWEPLREIVTPDEKAQIKSLQLTGLDAESAQEIIGDNYHKVNGNVAINSYQGHPLCLKNLNTLIQALGAGMTEIILSNQEKFFDDNLAELFQEQFNRLSDIEKQLMLIFLRENQLLTIAKLSEFLPIPQDELILALQSLMRRCLVTKQDDFFNISPLVRWYVMKVEIQD